MICVVNTFAGSGYGTIVSRHRTARAAYRAERKLQRDVKRTNGKDSYIPTEFWLEEPTGRQTVIDIYEALRTEGISGDEL